MAIFRIKNLVGVLMLTAAVAACSNDKDREAIEPEAPDATISEPSVPTPTPVENTPVMAEPLKPADTAATVSGFLDYVGEDKVYFRLDSAELSAAARGTLARQAEWLTYFSRIPIMIEGHCDERGTRDYNLALGERRANAVREYLVALGVQSSRISTISYGKERPLIRGSGEAVWSQNRRGTTRIR